MMPPLISGDQQRVAASIIDILCLLQSTLPAAVQTVLCVLESFSGKGKKKKKEKKIGCRNELNHSISLLITTVTKKD